MVSAVHSRQHAGYREASGRHDDIEDVNESIGRDQRCQMREKLSHSPRIDVMEHTVDEDQVELSFVSRGMLRYIGDNEASAELSSGILDVRWIDIDPEVVAFCEVRSVRTGSASDVEDAFRASDLPTVDQWSQLILDKWLLPNAIYERELEQSINNSQGCSISMGRSSVNELQQRLAETSSSIDSEVGRDT